MIKRTMRARGVITRGPWTHFNGNAIMKRKVPIQVAMRRLRGLQKRLELAGSEWRADLNENNQIFLYRVDAKEFDAALKALHEADCQARGEFVGRLAKCVIKRVRETVNQTEQS